MPLRATIDSVCDYSLPSPLWNATVADFYNYHPVDHYLSPKQNRNDIPYSANSVARFRNALATDICKFSPVSAQCTKPTSLSLFNPVHVPAIRQSSNFFAFRRRLLLGGDDSSLNSPSTSCQSFRR